VFPGQPAGCDADWTTDPESLGGLSEVMAIRVVSTRDFVTGEGVQLGYTMSVPTVDRDQVAWNSVASFARTTAGVALLPSEAPKVGITASDRRFTLSKTVDETSARPGDVLTYTLSVTNAGTADSVPTTVTDNLPAGLDFVSVDAPGSWNASSRTVTWPVPVLASGETVTLDLRAEVRADQTTTKLVNSASIVQPPTYSPAIVVEACDDDAEAACAVTSVPLRNSSLAVTGADLAPALIAAALAALLGVAFVLTNRRKRVARH